MRIVKVAGVVLATLVLVRIASGYAVVFPSTLKPKAMALVDDAGQLLFGANPAKVEVTNLPGAGTIMSAAINVPNATTQVALTTPASGSFLLTQVCAERVTDVKIRVGSVLVLNALDEGCRTFVPGLQVGQGVNITCEDGDASVDHACTVIGLVQ